MFWLLSRRLHRESSHPAAWRLRAVGDKAEFAPPSPSESGADSTDNDEVTNPNESHGRQSLSRLLTRSSSPLTAGGGAAGVNLYRGRV